MDPHDSQNPADSPKAEQASAPTENASKGIHFRKRWLIYFGVLALVFVSAYCIVNRDKLALFFSSAEGIGNVLAPLFIGCIIAYLLNPILEFYEYVIFRKLKRKGNLRLYISILCTFLTALLILSVLVAMVIPELYKSIKNLVTDYQSYLNGLLALIQTAIDKMELNVDISDMEKLYAFINEVFGNAEDFMSEVLNKLQNFVFDSNLLGNVWGFLGSLFSSVINAVLGLFIAFYILSSKEKRVAQVAKFRAAHLSDKQDGKLTEVITLMDKTFGGYFKGVLVDALIVGITMFLALSICRVSEYNLLIATICAITNVIPVFGPLIGAVPSGIIILMTNPEKLIWFIIIVLIIQQLDGNILVPLIQGNNTGISSLAVLIAITVMGGLFKIPGMIFGVPIFAVVIELCKRGIEEKLRGKNKETDTTHYYRKGAVGNAEEEVYYEHAHWKYKYDHSRIKPHVDKFLAAVMRLGKRITGQAESAPASEEGAAANDAKPFEDTVPLTPEEAPAEDVSPEAPKEENGAEE